MLTDLDQVVDAVIDFANGDVRPPWKTRAYDTRALARSVGLRPPPSNQAWIVVSDTDIVHTDAKTARKIVEEGIRRDREFVVALLDFAVAGRATLARKLGALAKPGSSIGISLTPRIHIEGERVSLDWQVEGGALGARSYAKVAAAQLAIRASKDDQTAIGRCHLESCRRFFLIPRGEPGKPRTKYCKPEHRLKYHSENAAERQRRSRAARRPR